MGAWGHLVMGVAATVAAVLLLVLLLAQPGALWIVGLLLLAGAAWLWFWGFERDELFKDDWVEMGEIALVLVCAVTGIVFLALNFVA